MITSPFTGKRKRVERKTDMMRWGQKHKATKRECRACGRNPWPNQE